MPDHVHVLLAIPPKYSVASVMGYLKGKSSLMITQARSTSSATGSSGRRAIAPSMNEATMYIREQESHDIALDKLSVKEYEDPFKRGDPAGSTGAPRVKMHGGRQPLDASPGPVGYTLRANHPF